jgi:hypothetical protein
MNGYDAQLSQKEFVTNSVLLIGYNKNFIEFAFAIEEIDMLRCDKMKFCNAWSCRKNLNNTKRVTEIKFFAFYFDLMHIYILNNNNFRQTHIDC